MPVVETKGSASSQGFGEFAKSGGAANYIEDVFSTYLYTGTGSVMTITNGIDLAGKGGLVWVKQRDASTRNHCWVDTARGTNQYIASNDTSAQSGGTSVYSFDSNGFKIGNWTDNGTTFASWTFRKQAKFFDIVTYTGDGANRTIAHNLGSTPGCIMIKCTSTASNWIVYHRGLPTPTTGYMSLNTSGIVSNTTSIWNSTAPTATDFSIGTNANVNQSGQTFVAYLFAHNAGGFGLAGTDNVISCGGVQLDSGGFDTTVNLGYEPQWILVRPINVASNWTMFDNMRGWAVGGSQQRLRANLTNIEDTQTNWINITATGFVITSSFSNPGDDVIYIAIRRGPMKTPTSGTSVFAPVISASATPSFTTGFPVDSGWAASKSTTDKWYQTDRLRGDKYLNSTSTAAEAGTSPTGFDFDYQNGFWDNQGLGTDYIGYGFRRAPSFFDEVCYTGNGVQGRAIEHNLQAIPELIICKQRNNAANWYVWATSLGATEYLRLQLSAAKATDASVFGSAPNSTTTFPTGGTSGGALNASSQTYVAYLFATCAGVSKVGSYTGTGTTKQIDCGFTGGARFVLIKRTDSAGDWYVWDSARGIVAGNDPYLLLNSTAAEVTNTDYIDTYSAGFEISSTAPAAINANGGTFIFLAVA